jgi:branched-chain amino acid transport system ATP-binding protein
VSTTVLAIEELTTGYEEAAVIRGLDLTVDAGEVVALLGANGAGKTTTLRAISGVVHPMSGRVVFAGRDLAGRSISARARAGIAHVPETRGLFFGLTVAEHLRLSHRGERLDADAAYEYFPALAELKERRCGLLSGGEQQMLAVSRALATRPAVLLLDELSMGLGPMVVEELYAQVKTLTRRGVAILLVEQFAAFVLEVADQVAVLVNGEIRAAGRPGEMADLLRGAYLGAR